MVAVSENKIVQLGFVLAMGITLIMASAAILGWVANIPGLVQLTPDFVPMQFNTALCFLFIAMSGLLYYKGYFRSSLAFSGFVLALAVLTLIQYLTNTNLGIDELFMTHEITKNTSHPGRMAPKTALCFLLSSFCLIIYAIWPNHRYALNLISGFMTTVLALGLVAILGYIFGIETTYGWGAYTHMALQTAICFVAFGGALLGMVTINSKFGSTNNYQIPMLTGSLMLIVTLMFTNALHYEHISSEGFVHLVFWFGIAITAAFVTLILFFQRHMEQARTIIEQDKAKNAYKSEIEHSLLTLKLASDVAQLGTWRWNVNTGELSWDERMFEIYQTPDSIRESGLIYDYWYESVHPDDREAASTSLQKAVGEQKPWRYEFRLKLAGGDVKYIKASAICVIDNTTQTTLVFGGNLDITPERELQANLEEKTRLAEQSTLTKSRFLANMSHEIRTPMNGILGIGDLLAASGLNAKQAEYLSIMMSSANTLLSLLNDILDISKIEAGELKLERICVPIEEVIGDTLKSLASQAHEKGLDYHYVKDENVPEWVFTDPVRLGQILSNLVSNAIKFTESGEVLVKIKAENILDGEISTSNITIEVIDSGIGIESAQVEAMFKPFFQADEGTTRKYGGTGLGLSIVQQLVEAMNGKIKIESEPEKGTKVIFNIPLEVGTREELIFPTSVDYEYYADLASNALFSINCLVIDNQDLNREWLVNMLHSWQCNVTACSSAEEGISAIQNSIDTKCYYHAMIIEQKLYGKDVFECIARIRKICYENQVAGPGIVLIMATNRKDNDMKAIEVLEINEYLLKPIKQSEVFNAMMSAVGKKNPIEKGLPGITKVAESKQLNLLLAEDHPVNQYMVKEILEKRGHRLTIVENGRLAVEALENTNYDAIVMDVQMPVMDGLTATKLIRKGKNQSDIIIIGLTAKALKEDKNMCLDSGMDHYLTKPTNPNELIFAVESVKAHQGNHLNKNIIEKVKKSVGDTGGSYRVLDLERCQMTTGGDTKLLVKLLQLSLENVVPTLSELDIIEKSQNWGEIARAVHKSKGMLANFCKEEILEEFESLLAKAESFDNDTEMAVVSVIQPVMEYIKTFSLEAKSYLKSH